MKQPIITMEVLFDNSIDKSQVRKVIDELLKLYCRENDLKGIKDKKYKAVNGVVIEINATIPASNYINLKLALQDIPGVATVSDPNLILNISDVGINAISLTWVPYLKEAQIYGIEISTDNIIFSEVIKIPANNLVNSFTVGGLLADTKYYIKLIGYKVHTEHTEDGDVVTYEIISHSMSNTIDVTTLPDNIAIIDECGNVLTNVGNVEVDTAIKAIGVGSMIFNGTNYIMTPELNIGTGYFTIEGRYRNLPGVEGNIFTYSYQELNERGRLVWRNLQLIASTSLGNQMIIQGTNSSGEPFDYRTAITWDTEVWHHFAFVKTENAVLFFQDGILQVNHPMSGTWLSGKKLEIGGAQGYLGNIDEVRVSIIDRYTEAFTPSNAPFVVDENTTLLIHAG